MRGLLFAVAVGAALTVVAMPAVGGAAAVLPCRGGDLRATFTLVPGSPGAGNVVYTLRVRDVGRKRFVTGLPPGAGLGATVGPIRPTTSVCSHGAMSFTGFVTGKTGPPLA